MNKGIDYGLSVGDFTQKCHINTTDQTSIEG